MAYYKDSKELCLQALGPWVMKTAGQVFVNPHKNENLNKFYLFFIFFDISMLVSIGLIASIKKNLFSFWKKKRDSTKQTLKLLSCMATWETNGD